jgi:hypothetical protein
VLYKDTTGSTKDQYPMANNKTNRPAKQAANYQRPSRKPTSRPLLQKNGIGQSAMNREPVETAGAPLEWRRVLFAGVGAAVLTVSIVYIVFKVFGIAAGVTDGEVTAGEGAIAAAQQVSSWTTLILALIFTFLGALWSVRETVEKHLLQGFLVGLIAAILILGPLIGFLGGELDGFSIAAFFLTSGAGTIAGFFGSSR